MITFFMYLLKDIVHIFTAVCIVFRHRKPRFKKKQRIYSVGADLLTDEKQEQDEFVGA